MKFLAKPLGFALVALIAIVVVYWPTLRTAYYSGHGITEAAAGRIKPGMTQAEVESLFGCPAGDYRTDKSAPLSRYGLYSPKQAYDAVWVSDTVQVDVLFLHDRGVVLSGIKKRDHL